MVSLLEIWPSSPKCFASRVLDFICLFFPVVTATLLIAYVPFFLDSCLPVAFGFLPFFLYEYIAVSEI